MESYLIHAAPGTDIWKKPPHTHVFNAPTGVPSGIHSNTGKLKDFVSASLSFTFLCTERYDQAGLLFSLRKRRASNEPTSTSDLPEKWIKTGVEFYDGKPMLSVVTCDSWADWSIAPLHHEPSSANAIEKGVKVDWTTISIVKERDENGVCLWIYQNPKKGETRPLREVTWVYGLESDQWDVEILAMAARPAKNATKKLEVSFRDVKIDWET